MRIAIINSQTKIVENVAVAPDGTNVWFGPQDKICVQSNVASIGDTYNPTTKTFTKPAPPPEPEPAPEPPENAE